MFTRSKLATRFGRNLNMLRDSQPLSDEQIAAVVPSIFAVEKHESRSDRYSYIPTSEVLNGLRREGFQPFMVCQSKARDEGRREFTKHMIRLRHAEQIVSSEAQEIILINSHDGSCAYQLLAGVFRFACQNGLVYGNELADIRVPHKGDVTHRVIEGAFTVLDEFGGVTESIEHLKAVRLHDQEQRALAKAALTLRYDNPEKPAPITESQLLHARRTADIGDDVWSTFNRVQENMLKGGLRGRNQRGITTTRAISSIDNSVKLNRALWVLAEEMRALRSAAA